MTFHLLSAIHRATRQISLALEEDMGALGLSAPEGHMVCFLASYGPVTCQELTRVFGHKRSTLSSMLDRLEARGLLERTACTKDRRAVRAGMTAAGRALAGRTEVTARALEDAIRDQLDEAQLAGFDAVMAAVAQATGVAVRTETPDATPTPTPAPHEFPTPESPTPDQESP